MVPLLKKRTGEGGPRETGIGEPGLSSPRLDASCARGWGSRKGAKAAGLLPGSRGGGDGGGDTHTPGAGRPQRGDCTLRLGGDRRLDWWRAGHKPRLKKPQFPCQLLGRGATVTPKRLCHFPAKKCNENEPAQLHVCEHAIIQVQV